MGVTTIPQGAAPARLRTLATETAAIANVYRCRGVVTSNVSNLASFTVVSNDGLTYAAGEIVLLVKQSTATQDGPYVVGTVSGGTAALTRPTWWAAASVQPAGCEFLVNEGDTWKHHRWFATLAGAITVGTSAPAFYPRQQKGTTTALSGTPGTKSVGSVWLRHATESSIQVTSNTPGGTAGILSAPGASRTAGAGSGSFVINSSANDTTTADWLITN